MKIQRLCHALNAVFTWFCTTTQKTYNQINEIQKKGWKKFGVNENKGVIEYGNNKDEVEHENK